MLSMVVTKVRAAIVVSSRNRLMIQNNSTKWLNISFTSPYFALLFCHHLFHRRVYDLLCRTSRQLDKDWRPDWGLWWAHLTMQLRASVSVESTVISYFLFDAKCAYTRSFNIQLDCQLTSAFLFCWTLCRWWVSVSSRPQQFRQPQQKFLCQQ